MLELPFRKESIEISFRFLLRNGFLEKKVSSDISSEDAKNGILGKKRRFSIKCCVLQRYIGA